MRYRQNSKHSWSVKFVGFIFSTKTNEESVSKQLTPSDTEVITAAVLTRSGRMVEIIQRNQFWLSPRVKDHHFFWMCFWSCSYFPHTHRVFCNGQNVKPTEKCCKSNSAYGPRDPEILNYSVPSVRNLYDAPISHFDVLINFTGVSLVHKKQQQLLLLANAIELVTGKQSGGKTSECLLRKGKAPQGEFKCE